MGKLYCNCAKHRLRCGYTAAIFTLYFAYTIELVQSRDWDTVILQLSSVYIVHTVLNWFKAETEKWLYCRYLLYFFCILFWTCAKQRQRCCYTVTNFCLYCAYFFEVVQSRDWDVVIIIYLRFMLCILNWNVAKQGRRCVYNAANFCLYCE